METTGIIFTAIIPIFAVIGSGFFARKRGWLSEEADQSLMKLVVNLLYPALIFSYILGNQALEYLPNVLFPPLIGFAGIILGFGLAMRLARVCRIGSNAECRTFAFTAGIYNYGYFPIPIIALLFDRETTGVLLVHNVGVELAMWAIGVGFILSAEDSQPLWRRVLSGPVIAILLAVPMNAVGLDAALPEAVLRAVDLLGQCAIPIGLILIGATFADLSRSAALWAAPRLIGLACLLRLGLIPIIFLFVAWIFPFSRELTQVLIIQAAMPCAVFPIVLARHFGGSPDVALRVVLSTTLLSFFTIPLWIALGLYLLG